MTITETTTIADIAATVPSAVRVFQRHGIDFCCGGKKALAAVCDEHHLPFSQIANAIAQSAAEPSASDCDWTTAPLGTLIDHIVRTYHDALREELPRLEGMAVRVAGVHGAKDSGLQYLQRTLAELSADLTEHMEKEERILFPSVRAREQGAKTMPLSQPIRVMESDHDRAGALLAAMRTLTSDYTVPAWGCATVRALFQGLAELESAMHVHVHLENNVLFPRAIALEAAP